MIKLIIPSAKQQKTCPHKSWGVVIGSGELICNKCFKVLTKKDLKAIFKRMEKNNA